VYKPSADPILPILTICPVAGITVAIFI